MTQRIFFLSHNKEDKSIVRRVAQRIGYDLCWVDEGEIRAGEDILDKIDHGIADSRIFVLFWSTHSAKSSWVREEVSQARIRALRDSGFRLVVVRLDKTELPNYLAYRLSLDLSKGVDFVVKNLRETACDLTPPEVFIGSLELKDSFQNRENEIDTLEKFLLSEDYSGILIMGLNGIGKTALVKRATAKLFPHLTPVWVNLDVVGTPLRILSALARPLSIIINPDLVTRDPETVWRDTILPDISQSEKLFIVLDNFGSPEFTRGPSMDQLLRTITSDLVKTNKYENPGLIVISSFQPELDKQTLARLGVIIVRGLNDRDMVRAMRFYLQRISAHMKYNSGDLRRLVKVLHGYPLALGLASAQVAERGLELVLSDLGGLHKLLIRLAQELVSGIPLSEEEKTALVLFATAQRPLNSSLAKRLLEKNFNVVDKLIAKQLLDLSEPGYALHGVIRGYVLESMASPEQIKDGHNKLSQIFRKEWEKAPDLSATAAELGSLAFFHTLAGGRRTDASVIKFAYREEAKEAAIELYRRGDYKTALAYLENLKKMETPFEPILKFYYALSLNRARRSEEALDVIQSLVNKDPTMYRYHHAMGSILARLGRDKEALDAFRKAVATSRRKNVVALASLARHLCRMGRQKEALGYAKEAYGADPGDSQVINVLVQVYHELGEDTTALGILDQATKRRRTDTRLHARAGIFAKNMGDWLKAKEHLTKASFDLHTITALADVFINLEDFEAAERVLKSYPHGVSKQASYWSTKAKILRRKGEFSQALPCIQKALGLESGNPAYYGESAQLHMDMAKKALRHDDIEKAHLQVDMAWDQLNRGLRLDPKNESLLSLRERLQKLKEALS